MFKASHKSWFCYALLISGIGLDIAMVCEGISIIRNWP